MRDHLEWLSELAEKDFTARGTKWIPSSVPSLTQAGAVGVFNLPLGTIDSPFGDVRPALEARISCRTSPALVLVLHLPRESAYVTAGTTVWFWDHAFKVDAVDGSIELPWRASVTRPNEHVDPTMAPPAWSIDVELGHVNHLFVSGTASFFELPRMEGMPLDPRQRVERFLARRETSEALTLPSTISPWAATLGLVTHGDRAHRDRDLVRTACRLHAARVRILQRTGRHLSSKRRGLQLAHGRRPQWPLFQVRA